MLKEKVEETIKKFNLIEKGDKIVVGVSGGPDSITLINILLELKDKYQISLVVAHINHMIRENAKIDEEFVKTYCEKNKIDFFVEHKNILELAQKQKRGIEETGRDIRYNFFEEVLNETKANKIAIAHNLNDNCETVLMNIIRGTGINGLKGIEPKREQYIRPLIETSREEIEQYCKEKKINPRHDESNDDNTYTRNKIRNILIPELKEVFNPNIVMGIKRLSDIVKEEENFLEKETDKVYSEIIIDDKDQIVYDLKKFNLQDVVIQKRLILKGIETIFGDTKGIEKINLDDIIKLCNNNIGNKFLKPNQKTKIEIKNKNILIKKDN